MSWSALQARPIPASFTPFDRFVVDDVIGAARVIRDRVKLVELRREELERWFPGPLGAVLAVRLPVEERAARTVRPRCPIAAEGIRCPARGADWVAWRA
ncbi:hypothetical protein OHB26_31005 [Nocardia sp. NBC_01503]|uniref:hypothetical protein n=1 Tax=Nocardia sp. NBC_01503 TaxID=2975997 RepID=UPI002E7B8D6B|nr:hypothetical protein [Nocardia sp. NBC_01503]WTL31307.1 hypothetical protein OHB26_31005 [Nocardia sp. NBC_01503]